MKKIFTFLVLSIMAMTSIFAAETVLWEGSWYVSWEEPEGSEHREWKHLGQADFAAYEVGSTVCFYMEQAVGAEYAKYQIDNWSWVLLPGQSGTDFSGNIVAKLPITQEVKDAIAEGGFAIHGHGFNVVKATLTDEAGEEPQPQGDVLWEGDHFVSWHIAESDTENAAYREWKFLSQATFAQLEVETTLYFQFEPAPTEDNAYSAYKFDDGWWNTLPGTPGQVDFTTDTVATLVLTQDIKTIVAERGFAIHGHGFNVKKVSLSPIEILPTKVENVAIKNDGIRYNLMGQIVDESYKGIIILNGRKMIVR
ncbi:MAG: hypothetical protein IKV22_04080 [Paludibacteraceae bacterium]|nr:hypothetical protein [Paludibacteraceae bacterium]